MKKYKGYTRWFLLPLLLGVIVAYCIACQQAGINIFKPKPHIVTITLIGLVLGVLGTFILFKKHSL